MVPPADHPASLSVTRAFVVQFRTATVVEQGHLAGRVEHVVSGQATDFQSLETLLAFMARVLRAERAVLRRAITDTPGGKPCGVRGFPSRVAFRHTRR